MHRKDGNGLVLAFIALCAIAAMVVSPTAEAGDPDFGDFVKRLEREYDIKRMRIPGFFLARAFVRVARPAGVSRLDLAIFEDQDLSHVASEASLQDRVNALLGSGWKPFVEVNAPNKGERVLLYIREKGKKDVELFMLVLERNEGVVLQTRINPDILSRIVQDPEHGWRMFR